MADIAICDSDSGKVLYKLHSEEKTTLEELFEMTGKGKLTASDGSVKLSMKYVLSAGQYLFAKKQQRRDYGPDFQAISDNHDLRKLVLELQMQDSRAVSYSEYYKEKSSEGRINRWLPSSPPGSILRQPLRDVHNLPKGAELSMIKTFWKTILNNSLIPEMKNAYQVGYLGPKVPDISFFPLGVEKPTAGEFISFSDCTGSTWTGTSTSELGQGLLYGHRILDAQPQRHHVYGFVTNNESAILVKAQRQEQRPFGVHWQISALMTFGAGMKTFFSLLQSDNGFVPPPRVANSVISISYALRPGGSCRAFAVVYKTNKVVAKLYKDADKASEDAKLAKAANQAMISATGVGHAAKIPTVVGVEGEWMLITPVGLPFTAQTLKFYHIQKLLETLKLIHAAGIVHRDVRFSNIFMLENGEVFLNDWGSSVPGRDGAHQLVAGCPDRWCHPDLVGVSLMTPQAKHDLFSLVASAASLVAPGIVDGGRRLLFQDAFVSESADYAGVAKGFQTVFGNSSDD
jgi:hypothetical protein